MENSVKFLKGLCLLITVATSVSAPPGYVIPAKSELQLQHGSNEVKSGSMVLRIIKGFVGNLSVSGFDTYTIFVLPEKAGAPWLLVTAPACDPADKSTTCQLGLEQGNA